MYLALSFVCLVTMAYSSLGDIGVETPRLSREEAIEYMVFVPDVAIHESEAKDTTVSGLFQFPWGGRYFFECAPSFCVLVREFDMYEPPHFKLSFENAIFRCSPGSPIAYRCDMLTGEEANKKWLYVNDV